MLYVVEYGDLNELGEHKHQEFTECLKDALNTYESALTQYKAGQEKTAPNLREATETELMFWKYLSGITDEVILIVPDEGGEIDLPNSIDDPADMFPGLEPDMFEE